ncbi:MULTISPECIES: hypothetical protein [Pediococcus]|uniref:hypothetical protein n=1 Tax=Pediococcus TaxID=1253 RepID=UPI00070D1EEA|nr:MULTISPECIES: hypothetical protein [Pediococcus]MCT3027940.1 hypothetical protein [Pediococcus parvulus]MCT3029248.1 hypothetical protein [Pediococcus parvulus]MDN5575269.1 hypothetical protein [Pediococcus sp.]GEL90564.1 hypothetical protein PPA04_17950 [Pediococcus parvulus]GHC03806.1 hypothetical protein GCM10008912_03720 [Pediococcus parvulus]
MKNKIREFLLQKGKWYQDAGISVASLFVALVLYKLIGYIFTKINFLNWETIIGVVILYVIILFGWRYWELNWSRKR